MVDMGAEGGGGGRKGEKFRALKAQEAARKSGGNGSVSSLSSSSDLRPLSETWIVRGNRAKTTFGSASLGTKKAGSPCVQGQSNGSASAPTEVSAVWPTCASADFLTQNTASHRHAIRRRRRQTRAAARSRGDRQWQKTTEAAWRIKLDGADADAGGLAGFVCVGSVRMSICTTCDCCLVAEANQQPANWCAGCELLWQF